MAIEKVHIHIGVQLHPLWLQTNPQWFPSGNPSHTEGSSLFLYLLPLVSEYLSSQDAPGRQTLMNSPALTHILSSVTLASKNSPEP